MFVCVSVCTCMVTSAMEHMWTSEAGGFYPSTVWILGIELWSSEMTAKQMSLPTKLSDQPEGHYCTGISGKR